MPTRIGLDAKLLFPCLSLGFFKAHPGPATVLVDELDPRLSQNFLHQLEGLRVARVSSDFHIVDRISMKTCCLRKVPNRPIKSSSSHSVLCFCHMCQNHKPR